ncbi:MULTISPECIES: hypothetical protein [Siphonobacter]|uniref:Uncharacterized protein n=1 Tax=Siphonobacter curvatus TaxID=2094562 RepID=A0A2S7IRP4_9BACT|nr:MULTISPECIES: hypothetical protein [Siphonobacter]PMD94055.1 hypothetical protein BWI97_17480 [Siphonobacter sp. BAB-5405]PQA60391.1 hypothetical protein C5O19_12470 [Siphonobacter curvatus]
MSYIAIPLPSLPGKQEIEISVSINGQKQDLHYRVELFRWDDCSTPSFNRVECLREMLTTYDQEWSLYYIGAPTDDFVPITFVKKDGLTKMRTVEIIES